LILANEISIETDVNGIASLDLALGNYNLQVSKTGYDSKSILVSISRDTTISVLLIPLSADLKFRIYDGATPLNNVEISISDESKLSNALGMATFTGLAVGIEYFYTLSKNGFMAIDSSIVLLTNTTIDLQMQMASDIFYNQRETISIYPNPATDNLYIESDISIKNIELLHVSGKVVFSGKSNTSNIISVDISTLPRGAYVIKISTENNGVYRKLIVLK
jgi:hypothetical protein